MDFAVVAMDKIDSYINFNEIKEIYSNGTIVRNFDLPPLKDVIMVDLFNILEKFCKT
jgi:hypothetical protein